MIAATQRTWHPARLFRNLQVRAPVAIKFIFFVVDAKGYFLGILQYTVIDKVFSMSNN